VGNSHSLGFEHVARPGGTPGRLHSSHSLPPRGSGDTLTTPSCRAAALWRGVSCPSDCSDVRPAARRRSPTLAGREAGRRLATPADGVGPGRPMIAVPAATGQPGPVASGWAAAASSAPRSTRSTTATSGKQERASPVDDPVVHVGLEDLAPLRPERIRRDHRSACRPSWDGGRLPHAGPKVAELAVSAHQVYADHGARPEKQMAPRRHALRIRGVPGAYCCGHLPGAADRAQT